MKINIEIQGTEQEISRIVEVICKNSEIAGLITPRVIQEQDVLHDLNQLALNVFERLSWESFHLVNFIYANGELAENWLENKDWYVCTLSTVEKELGLAERNIRSRINGVKKSCDTLGIEPFVIPYNPTSGRQYCLNRAIEPELKHCLQKWKVSYAEWLQENNLKCPT